MMGIQEMVRPAGFFIREIEQTDYEQLTSFFIANNVVHTTRQFHPFPLDRETAYRIACTDHLDYYYITICNEHIVGLCMLRGWDEGYTIPSFGIFIDYRYWGKGLGRQMTEFATAEAKKLGCDRVRLSVYASNVHALHLYISLGFQEISREPVLVDKEPDLKIIMVKDLK